MNPVLDAILRRRSVAPRKLAAPGPGEACLARLISAAVAAPDHGRLKPWRFVRIGETARAALAEVNVAAALEVNPGLDGEQAARERERALHAPCLLAVIARIDEGHAEVPPHEQWISVGCAMQNILLAAAAEGFGAMIVSGRKASANAYRIAFGLAENEHFAGMIAMGTAAGSPRPKEAGDPAEFLAEWPN